MLRQLNPARLERTLISPLNPWLSWLKPAAEYVRAHRQPVSADNPLWQLQEQWSGWMEQGLNHYRDLRDAATEHCFKAVYESPWLASVVGVQPARETRAARCDSWDKQERLQLKRQVLDPAYESGTLADGFVRLLIYVAIGRGIIDERPFNAIRRIMRDIRHEYPMTLMQLKDIARKQVFLVRLDEARALAGLPKLLPQEHLRRQAGNWRANCWRSAATSSGTTTTAGPSGPHAATGRPRPGAGHPAARRAPCGNSRGHSGPCPHCQGQRARQESRRATQGDRQSASQTHGQDRHRRQTRSGGQARGQQSRSWQARHGQNRQSARRQNPGHTQTRRRQRRQQTQNTGQLSTAKVQMPGRLTVWAFFIPMAHCNILLPPIGTVVD